MALSDALSSTYERLGEAERTFRCCDTDFLLSVRGYHAAAAAARGERVARSLEAQLNAFDPDSAVSQLNRAGTVANDHVARIVRRGLEYYERTGGVFDIRHGRLEHDLKAYLRGERDAPPAGFDPAEVAIAPAEASVAGDAVSIAPAEVSVEGDEVRVARAVDLNGLAKGYLVDRAAAALSGVGREGFVSGGGDLSPPTGPIAIESPYGDARPLKYLDTSWNVATSGGYRRRRGGSDHIYDPTTGRVGSRHESVTVLARRDCMEADALATTLAALPLDEALSLATEWPHLEALIVHEGVFHPTGGFARHVLDD